MTPTLPALPGLLVRGSIVSVIDRESCGTGIYVGHFRVRTADGFALRPHVADPGGGFGVSSVDDVELKLDEASGRDRLIRWLADGERCAVCDGTGQVGELGGRACCTGPCYGTGYLRRPHDVGWMRDGKDVTPAQSASLLRCSALRVAAGLEPVRGMLGEWRRREAADDWRGWVRRPIGAGAHLYARDAGGWYHPQIGFGPETGADGQRLADAAALAAGFALDGDELTLPEVP